MNLFASNRLHSLRACRGYVGFAFKALIRFLRVRSDTPIIDARSLLQSRSCIGFGSDTTGTGQQIQKFQPHKPSHVVTGSACFRGGVSWGTMWKPMRHALSKKNTPSAVVTGGVAP